MWSMYKKSQTEVEDSEAWQLAQIYPNAACHDGTNVVFVTALPDAVDPYVLPETESISDMVMLAAAYLFQEQEHGLHLTKAQAKRLFNHPAHRLWCARYEEDQQALFESDYNANRNYALSVGLDNWPEFSVDLTPADARNIMLETLTSSSVT
ncbi:hypothetical protein [Neptunomonas sp.]|uniref:hypothetical protein n=1 Tax=Neptunomonas TaxID=75687 RepID=UPI003515C96E